MHGRAEGAAIATTLGLRLRLEFAPGYAPARVAHGGAYGLRI